MAADMNVNKSANLTDLPADFSLSYLRDSEISLKSRQTGFKFADESYFHDVRIRRNEDMIVCSGRCFASYKTRDEPRKVEIEISPTLRLISLAHCSCQAGASQTCSHLIGFIIALNTWQLLGLKEVPAELSCTSMPQRWSVPRGTKVEPQAVPHMTFLNPKPIRKKRPIRNILTDNRKMKVQRSDLDVLKGLQNSPLSYLVCNPDKTIETHLGPVPVGSGLSTHAEFFEPIDQNPVGTDCGDLVFPKTSLVRCEQQFDSATLTRDECVEIEQGTRGQASCREWFDRRKGRLTASNFGKILKRKKITEKFVEEIIEPKDFTSVPTSYGKSHEKKAVQKYIKKSGNHVHDCGLVINDAFPFIGASPDAKVCENGSTGIVEVKCPYSARDMTVVEACNLPGFFMEATEDNICKLKTSHNYYYQVQGQLMVTGVQFCDFVVYTKKDMVVQRIVADMPFMQDMLNNLTRFYSQYVNKAN